MPAEEEQGFCRWMCTCLCANYVELCNKLMFAMGVIVLIFCIVMFWYDSGNSLEAFKDIGSVSKVKWGLLASGILIMIAACLGLCFAKNRSRKIGCGYLVCILIAVLLEFVLVSVGAGGALSDIRNINKVSGEYAEFKVSDKKSDDYKAMIKSGKDKVYAKVFRSVAERFNNPGNTKDNACRLVYAGEKNDNAAKTLLASVRRLEATTKQKCQPKGVTVDCKGKGGNLMFSSDRSSAKPGHEQPFIDVCTLCVDEWWNMWKMEENSKGSETKIPNLEEKWKGEPGTFYCRFAGRLFNSVERNFPKFRIAGMVLGVLQLALVASTVWLLMCGQASTQEEESPASPMELGQQLAPPTGGMKHEMQLVTCPPGALPGTSVMIHTSDGTMMQTIVPPGIRPGMQFQIQIAKP